MILETNNLTIVRAERTLCQHLTFTVNTGEIWAILGPNGCGKTTLLMTLAGLLPAHSGSIDLDNQSLLSYSRKALAKKLGMLFQHQEDSFPLTVKEVVEQSCFPHHALWQSPSPNQHLLIDQALKDFELQTLSERDIRLLSGGERQRVALACLQIQNATLWLLDEPTNHLDIPHQLGLLQRLKRLSTDHEIAMIMALHNVNQVMRVATHTLLMLKNGEWISGTLEEVINANNLEAVYGCQFDCMRNNTQHYWIAK